MKNKREKKQSHSDIKRSIKSLSQEMVKRPVSMGEGEEYYQLDALRSSSYMTEDLEHIKSCMQKMMGILSSLDHFNALNEQRYVSIKQEIDKLNIEVAMLKGHDNMFH